MRSVWVKIRMTGKPKRMKHKDAEYHVNMQSADFISKSEARELSETK
jgi:hypothetical protein